MRDPTRMMGAKGRVRDGDREFDLAFWAAATPEERTRAVFELRELYYEVICPGNRPTRLDRAVGGTRRLRETPEPDVTEGPRAVAFDRWTY